MPRNSFTSWYYMYAVNTNKYYVRTLGSNNDSMKGFSFNSANLVIGTNKFIII